MAVQTRQDLPFPLIAPYFVSRADAWQARIMEAARNYFTPAEMSDLQRIGIRFVPQEADRIKRHLRRKGDYKSEVDPDDRGTSHPRNTPAHIAAAEGDQRNAVDVALARTAILGNVPSTRDGTNTFLAPNVDANGVVPGVQNVEVRRSADIADVPDGVDPNKVAVASENSLLRRTQLFIGTMFVFDLAHALLRHLRQEALSLTANGSEADDSLLRQLARNVRGMTFRKLRLVGGGAPPAAGAPPPPPPVAGPGQYLIKDDSGQPRLYEPIPVTRYADFEDLFGPFSSTELESLRTKGWVGRKGIYYTPHRLPEWLGALMNGVKNSDLYITNPQKLNALRNQGVYPTSFLTNGVIADDTAAARLTEHVNSPKITTEFFTWQMRKTVFIPLELDVIDITRFQDIEKFDRLGDYLNAFGTGMYQGMNISQLFPTLQRDYNELRRDVPRNLLGPFKNVAKQIQLPATASAPRRTFANEEVIRLYTAADDVLRILDEWRRTTGRLDEVSFEDYMNPGPADPATNPDHFKKVLGNRPEAVEYGRLAFGIDQCGPGQRALAYTADPNTNHNAKQVPATIVIDGREVPNPQAQWFTCPPRVGFEGRLDVGTGDDVFTDTTFDVIPRPLGAQKRTTRSKSKSKKRH